MAQDAQSAGDANSLEEIVVTAQRAGQASRVDAKPMDLPIAIQSVPIDVIEDQGFVRLGDAVRTISGVVRKEAYFGLTDSFGIRGFDASTGLFNGFRHDYYGQVVDLAHVESVEVIKGPASISTGFLEPGGVVNVVTKRPLEESLTEVDLSVGSYNRLRAQGDISRQLNDTISYRLTGALERTDSFRDDVNSRRWTGGAAIDWKPTETTKVEFSGYYQDLHAVPDRGFPNNPIAFQLPVSRFLGEPSDTYHLKQKETSILIDQGLIEGLSLRGGFDWSRSDDLRMNTQLGDLQPDNRTYTRGYTVVPGAFDTKTAFGEVHAAFDTFGITHKLVAGADWTDQVQVYNFLSSDDVPSIDIFDPIYGLTPRIPGPSAGDFRGTTEDVGFYANDLIGISDQVKLLVSVRHDNFNYHDHDKAYDTTTRFRQGATTPRVGVVYQPIPSVSLYANYARSFNPQQFTILRNGQIPAPSEGEQIEGGVKYQTEDGRWTASAAVYQIRKTNVSTPDPTDNTGTFSILSGEDRSRGIELDVSARPIDGLQFIAAYSHMIAEVTSDVVIPMGDGLVNDPRDQASLWGRYDIPETPFGIGGGIYYVGQREATLPNSFKIPGYVRIDLAGFWQVREGMELAVNVQNITDKTYYDSQDNSFFPGTPRSVLATLRTKF
jgi:iron complex outermembrane receptor protein